MKFKYIIFSERAIGIGGPKKEEEMANVDKMIYGFNQEKVTEVKGVRTETRAGKKKQVVLCLDISDLIILKKVIKFIANPKGNRIIEGRNYTLLDYDSIVENLPILGLTNVSLGRRFKKYKILELLDSKLMKNKERGTLTFFAPTEKLMLLTEDGESQGDKVDVSIEALEKQMENYKKKILESKVLKAFQKPVFRRLTKNASTTEEVDEVLKMLTKSLKK